uniref:Flavonoid-6-hydroxylase n=1 Tax=Scutellaria baicalensis TaxID=65409 RepID=A0A286RS89_SCUBA|nr:cytochrome P450 CYP82D1.2 [Scutellaria baicalensis]
MELSSVIYGAIALLSLFYCYLHFSKPKKSSLNAPPEAGGARFITGHLHLMDGRSASDKLPHINLGLLADQHGPIFTIRLGVHRAVVVSSWELAKEIFTTHDTAVMARPRLIADDYLSYDGASLGFSPYGPYWREIRKLVTTELYKLWEEKKDGSGRVLVDMKQWLGNLSLNLVSRMVVGKRFYGGDDSETTKRWRGVMREFFQLIGQFIPGDGLPFLRWLDLGGFEKRTRDTAYELDKIIAMWLAEYRKREYSGDDKEQCFMALMLSLVQANPTLQLHYDADTIIKATCQVLISAASDTTTVILIWVISLLLNNADVLKKVQEELDEQVGRERRVEESDISNLPYLQAVVKETMRLYPPAPFAGVRAFSEDCTVGGYHIQKGTFLIVNLWKLHRDPRVWSDDALEFKPQRFFDKKVEVKGQDFELMPFGGGRRMCPGSNLGMHMVHFVLANILQAFDITTGSTVDMTESVGLTNMKATPLDAILTPRLSPTLY